MKILFLATDAYGGHGGIACYNRCLCEALAAMPEVREVVVLPRVVRRELEPRPEKVRFLSTAAGSKLRFLGALAGLARETFDLIICGHINLLPAAAVHASLKRTPLLLQVHGIDVWAPQGWRRRLALRAVKNVWSVSRMTRDRMDAWAGLGTHRYTVIPNTIRLDAFGLAPRREDLVARHGLRGRKVLMTLARLAGHERYKGIDEIIEVLPAIAESEPRISYLVMGEGDDRARLERKARALGVADRVIFTGFVPEAEKAAHLRLADAFVLPGRGEGFGIVYLEALACGVPVVGSRLDGSREALLDGELGELADPTDLASVRDCVLRALARPHEVPPGLARYDWPRFEEQVRAAILASVPARSPADPRPAGLPQNP